MVDLDKFMQEIGYVPKDSERSQIPPSKDQRGKYRIERAGFRWHVRAGTGTRSLGAFYRKRRALQFASELRTAFFDGIYVAAAPGDTLD